MKSITLIIATFTLIGSLSAQIDVNTPTKDLNIEQIIKSIDGEGIIVQNIRTNQKNTTNQLAQFNDHKLYTGMQNGVLLSTGSVKQIVGENQHAGMTGQITTNMKSDPVTNELNSLSVPITEANVIESGIIKSKTPTPSTVQTIQIQRKESHDADMKAVLGGKYRLYDACIVEMDIIPLGDTLSFRYMFASEEYDEYVGSLFNDAFAFFISGPGIEGKKNLAVLESGSRVSVNSINNGNPTNNHKPTNPSFYNKNNGQIPLEFDGFTRTLEVVESVIPFETYHLKLVITDATDWAYDSGVFIEEGSVISYDHKYVVQFDTDVSNLDEKARKILLSMTQIAEDHPEYVLQISGHTDSDGSEASNLILSQNRINSVIDFLEGKGFSADNILTVNKGESMPMTTNQTEEGRKQNRRVELKLIPSENEHNSKMLSTTTLLNYPNPATTSTVVKVESDDNHDGGIIRVFSSNGEFIAEQTLSNSEARFDTSNWDAGIYFYSLITEGKRIAASRLVIASK